jgi:hypothetical protein
MTAIRVFDRTCRASICGAILCLLIAAAPAFGGGGNVLPSRAKPKGYSLTDAAAATAYFNTGLRAADTLPEDFPFQILYVAPGASSNTFTVKAGTMFYVPVVFSDDLDSALWPFPDVTDPEAVSDYYFDPEQLGAEFITVAVDGKVTALDPRYAVGAVTPGLPDGGNSYTVAAAFLTPLSKGTHTVTIASRFSGAFIAMHPDFFPGGVFESETTYTVIVR